MIKQDHENGLDQTIWTTRAVGVLIRLRILDSE